MDCTKKATILFPPDLWQQLAREAKRRESSVGELVRNACRLQYGLPAGAARLAAVREMATLQLPVGTPEEMERESVAMPEPLP